MIFPAYSKARHERSRASRLRAFEEECGARVTSMIHRQEAVSFMDVNLPRDIDIEDSEAILRAIRQTDHELQIDVDVPYRIVPPTAQPEPTGQATELLAPDYLSRTRAPSDATAVRFENTPSTPTANTVSPNSAILPTPPAASTRSSSCST